MTWWKNINDSTANGIITRLHNRWRLREPHPHKEIAQSGLVNAPPDLCAKGRLFQYAACRNTLCGGIHGRQQNKPRWHVMHQCGQCCHTRCRNISIGGHAIIGQTIPRRKFNDRYVRGKKRQCLGHGRHTFVIPRNMHHGRPLRVQFAQNQFGVIPFGRTAHFDVLRTHNLS